MKGNLTPGKRITQLEKWVRDLQKKVCLGSAPINTSGGEASVNVSEEGESKYLLQKDGNNIKIDGSKIRDINSTDFTTYFDIPSYALTGGVDPAVPLISLTKEGAINSGTIEANGMYDKITVAGGDTTSRLMFNNYITSDASVKHTLRVQVETLGSTPSYVGIIRRTVGIANDATSGTKACAVNLNNNTIYRSSAVGNVGASLAAQTTTYNGSGTFVTNGDIIEFEWICDGLTGTEYITVTNLTTGYSLTAKAGPYTFYQGGNGFCNATQKVGIILSGGTSGVYNFMGMKAQSLIPNKSKILMFGDSMCSGYNASHPNALYSQITAAIPYNLDSFSGSGNNLNSLARSLVTELPKKRPQLVLYISYLPLYFGDFRATDPDYAVWYASWQRVMQTIVAIGARPIVAKATTTPLWPAGSPLSGDTIANVTAAWNAFVDTEMATYNGLVLDLSTNEYTFVYNGGAGFHFGPADNAYIASKLITLLEANSLL